jgi:hypothetical protein
MQLVLLMVVVVGGTGDQVEGAALVAVTSAVILPHLARGDLEAVVTTTVEAAVVVMVVAPHTVVVDTVVELGLRVPGINVIVAP